MSVNYVNSGERIYYVVPGGATVSSGRPVTLLDKVFVALSSGTAGEEITLARAGRFTLPKAQVVIAQGETLYWDADGIPAGSTSGTGAVTNVATDNLKLGLAAEGAAAPVTSLDVILITTL